MTLQKTGVILTAENETGFLRAMNNSRAAVSGFESGVDRAQTPMRGISMLSLTMANVIGGVVVNALSAAASGFVNLTKTAVGVVAANERLVATFESMVAKELRAADSTLSMTDALDAASPRARELLKWIEALVIKSPFERQGIVAALQTAVAYGFVTQGAKDLADAQAKGIVTAQRLAEAEVNWAAATGKTSFEVQRATLALGQMQAKGKVTGEELRQLREAGVDVQSALNAMGVSLDEVSKGTVSADEFIKKLVETMENDFGAAAERQAGTLTGLLSSIGDLSQTYLREFFGPLNEETGKLGGILGAVQPYLQKFVDTLTQPQVVQGIQTIGLLLGDVLSTGLQKAGDFAGNFATKFGNTMMETATRAFEWGANIAIQLASGIIEGAATAIIGAINFISGILSNWLAPGSPPKVAPNLPVWGKAAMVEWLKGFSQADFGVLKGIQGPLQGALNALAGAGKIKQKDIGKIYQDITGEIAKVIAKGGDPAKIYDKLKKATKEFGPVLVDLAKKQFAVAEATKQVEAAEKALKAAREAEGAAGAKIAQLTQEYNDMLRGGASKDQLKAKMGELNAQEEALVLAKQQGKEAEGAYSDAKDNLDILQEQLKTQQDLVQTLIDLANAQNKADAAAAGGAGGPGAPKPPEMPKIEPLDTGKIEGAFSSMLDRIKKMIKEKFFDAFRPLIEAFVNAKNGILEAWDNLLALFVSSGLEETFQGIWNNIFTLTALFWEFFIKFIQVGIGTITQIWNNHRIKIANIVTSAYNLITQIIGNTLSLIISNIAQRLEEAKNFFQTHKDQIEEIINLLWEDIQRIIETFLGPILDFIQERLDFLQNLWDTHGQALLGVIDNTWDAISTVFFAALGKLLDFIQGFLQIVRDFWAKHGESITVIVTAFLNTIGGIFDTVLQFISTIILGFVGWAGSIWTEHGQAFVTIIDLAFNAVLAIIKTILDLIGLAIEFFAALITGDWQKFSDTLQEIWDGLWGGIQTAAETIIGTILTSISGFVADIQSAFSSPDWGSIGSAIVSGIATGISNGASAIVSAAKAAAQAALKAAKEILGIESPSKAFMIVGDQTMAGMSKGIQRSAKQPEKQIGQVAYSMRDTMQKMIAPPMVSQLATSNYYQNSMEVNFNNNVNNGMDLATLNQYIRQVVTEAFKGI